MKWFRFYNSVLNDPKIQRLEPSLFKSWANILCIASDNEARGALPPLADIAFALRLPELETSKILVELQKVELVDMEKDGSFSIHEWDKWQYESDDVSKRVAKTRAKKGNVSRNVTNQLQVTAPEQNRTDTEADTEAEQRAASAAKKPYLENVLIALDKTTEYQMGRLGAGKIKVHQIVDMVIELGHTPQDILDYRFMDLPAYVNKSPENTNAPTIDFMLREYRAVKERGENARQRNNNPQKHKSVTDLERAIVFR